MTRKNANTTLTGMWVAPTTATVSLESLPTLLEKQCSEEALLFETMTTQVFVMNLSRQSERTPLERPRPPLASTITGPTLRSLAKLNSRR